MGAACHPPEPLAPELHVLEWTGSTGQALALDQDLLIRFDAELRVPLRPSSIQVLDGAGRNCGPFELEVRGALLILHPALPRTALLGDGALPAGSELRIGLAGVPSLQAIGSEEGGLLRGQQELVIHTLSADQPAALVGFPIAAGVVHLAEVDDSGVLRVTSARLGTATVRFSAALDPRSLRGEARLELDPGAELAGEVRSVPIRLLENHPEEALVELELGDWHGRGVLIWPEGMEALGGYPLAEAHRRVRLWRSP